MDTAKGIPHWETNNGTLRGCENGALMDTLGVLLQTILALIAFSTLMLKRFREPKVTRRPWQIWFYDTSKQGLGAFFIHMANVFLSDLVGNDPCSLYLINFLLDATLGMILIWMGIKLAACIVEWQQWNLLVFGEYGDPPRFIAWLGQSIIYLLIMVCEKIVIVVILLTPGWTQLQKVLLSCIPDPRVELATVMLIVPFLVNAIMFWVVDNLIMRQTGRRAGTRHTMDGSKKTDNRIGIPVGDESQVLLGSDLDPEYSENDYDWPRLRETGEVERKRGRPESV